MFKDNNVEEGYPRPISDFGLPPGGVDAAFSWAHNDKTYFFKDQLYWRYDEHTRRMDPGHPAQSPPWRGIPSTLDDAMRWSDGEPGTGGRATPGQPQPPHLGSWDPAADACVCSAPPLHCRHHPPPEGLLGRPFWPLFTSRGPFLAPVTPPAIAALPPALTHTHPSGPLHLPCVLPNTFPTGFRPPPKRHCSAPWLQ